MDIDGLPCNYPGPKQAGRTELDVHLVERAQVIAADSIEQMLAYEPPFVL